MQMILTTELLLEAYRQGLFPMAESAESASVQWICPEMRGQLSIEAMHIPRKLKRCVRQMKIKHAPYEILIDTAFEAVIKACAQVRSGRDETWINDQILNAYCELHAKGYAHSVECWQEGQLVGGLYGLVLGRAFFGESMFSRQTDASKVALAHLAARLWKGGFTVLDTQFVNAHLEQFGVYEIPYRAYMELLAEALVEEGDFLLSGVAEKELIEAYFEMRTRQDPE